MKWTSAVLVSVSLVAAGCSSGTADSVQRGAALVDELGCTSCHSAEIGPDWVGEWGTARMLRDGSRTVFNEAYVRRAIAEPDVEVVEGYDPVMPRYSLDEEQLTAIIAYLRTGP